MICGIACATAARTPLLGVACHVSIQQGDTEAGIQEWRAARRCWLKGKRWLKAGTRVRFPPTAVSIDGP